MTWGYICVRSLLDPMWSWSCMHLYISLMLHFTFWLNGTFCIFARRSFMDNQGSVSGRRSSVSSMTSVDLRVRYAFAWLEQTWSNFHDQGRAHSPLINIFFLLSIQNESIEKWRWVCDLFDTNGLANRTMYWSHCVDFVVVLGGVVLLLYWISRIIAIKNS